MDDLQAVTRALVDAALPHRVMFGRGREPYTIGAEVFAGWIHARFTKDDYAGTWNLTKATYDRRPETITGLLNSIRGA